MSFNPSRYARAITVLIAMSFCGVYSLAYMGLDYVNDYQMLIPFAIMMVGVVATASQMKSSLRDVMTYSCFFTGLFIMAASVLSYDFIANMDLTLPGFISGLILAILGVSVWCGYEFGISGIRYMLSVFVALNIAGIWYFARTEFITPVEILAISIILVTVLLEISILVLSMDKSIGYAGATTLSRHALKMQSASLPNIRDGYILLRYAESIHEAICSEGEARIVTRMVSNMHGDKSLELRKDADGKAFLIINDMGGAGSTLMSVEVVSSVLASDSITIFGKDGHWTRILVYDSIQDDYSKPRILGRELGPKSLKVRRKELEDGSSTGDGERDGPSLPLRLLTDRYIWYHAG